MFLSTRWFVSSLIVVGMTTILYISFGYKGFILRLEKNTLIDSLAQLKRLSQHQYSAQDVSWLDELCMKRFWDWLVTFYPLWLAPNTITLIGFICNISLCCLLGYFAPTGKETAPWWAYLLCVISLFVYQALDATDGKQARRTNSASPLGELFDHGCDSLTQMFVSLEICLSMQLGEYPDIALYMCIFGVTLFYCAHWQTYCCGKLVFSKFDVTEAQFCVMGVCLISAILGPQFWSIQIVGIPLKLIVLGFSFLASLYNLYTYLLSVFTGGVGKNGSTVADTSVLFPLFPLLSAVVPPIVIFLKSDSGAFEQHFVLYCVTFGLVSSKITNNIVIAHMSRSELYLWDSVLVGPILLIGNQYFNTFLPEYPALLIVFVITVANVLIHVSVVVRQLCGYLKIDCFRIVEKRRD